MNKKMKILFTVSIVLNVFLVALAGGAAYRHMNSPSWAQARESLAPQTRHRMAREFQKNYKALKPVMQEARAEKRALLKILMAEEFDVARFEKGAKKLQALQAKIQKSKILAMGELARGLSFEERKKLSALFKMSLRNQHGGHGTNGTKRRGAYRAQHDAEKIDIPIPAHRPEE